jgi:hypothetical protein
MTYFQLDRRSEADATFKKLQQTVANSRWQQDRETQRFLHEAAAMIGDAASSPNEPSPDAEDKDRPDSGVDE